MYKTIDMGEFSQEEVILASITLVSTSMSLCGGFALLFTYSKIPSFQTPIRKLLVFLTIADIFTAFGYIIGTVNFLQLNNTQKKSTDPMCEAQSFITTYSSLSSFAWTSVIAIHLYALIRKRRDFDRNLCLRCLYHIIGWVLPGKSPLHMKYIDWYHTCTCA
jgi:G protein-coupled receptor 157